MSALRERFPTSPSRDIYATPDLGAWPPSVDAMDGPVTPRNRAVDPVPGKTQTTQALASIALRTVVGPAVAHLGRRREPRSPATWSTATWLPAVTWWWVLAGWLLLVSPAGGAARRGRRPAAPRGVRPGDHPRGGRVHARLWLAEQWVDELGAVNLSTAPWMRQYARLLGARVGRDVDLHCDPAGHRPAHARRRLLDRARGRPDGLLDRGRRAAPGGDPRPAPTPASVRARTLLPGRGHRCARRRSRPVRRSSAWSRRASGGPGRRPGRTARPAGRCSRPARDDRPSWLAGYAADVAGGARPAGHRRSRRSSWWPATAVGGGRWATPCWSPCRGPPSRRPA